MADPRTKLLPRLPREVGVVIPTHNRGRLLRLSLQCAIDQTLRPTKIVVVDDGSTDDIRSIVEESRTAAGLSSNRVAYVRFDQSGSGGCRASPARNFGLRLLGDVPYVWSLDSDDWAPPHYLETLVELIETDPRAGAAYPRLRLFGDRNETCGRTFDRDQLSRTNLTQSGALIRGDVLRQIGYFPEDTEKRPDDWAFWRRLASYGWTMVGPADVEYYWRRHRESFTGRNDLRFRQLYRWHETIDTAWNFVTIAIPFSGRWHTLNPLIDALSRQTWPHEHVGLLFLDASGCPEFGDELRERLYGLDFGELRYLRYPLPPAAGKDLPHGSDARDERHINHRVAGLWNWIGQKVSTDLVWCLEDDVIPPPNALRQLIETMHGGLDAVAGVYPHRPGGDVDGDWPTGIAQFGRDGKPIPLGRGVGVQTVEGFAGFGCLLLRTHVLRDNPAWSSGAEGWYDCNVFRGLHSRGGSLAVNWDVLCEHLTPAPAATAEVDCAV